MGNGHRNDLYQVGMHFRFACSLFNQSFPFDAGFTHHILARIFATQVSTREDESHSIIHPNRMQMMEGFLFCLAFLLCLHKSIMAV